MTDAIRQDHAMLRKRLALVRSALQVAPETRFVVREMAFALQRQLAEHIERETRALQLYYQRLPARGRADAPAPNHADVLLLVREVNGALLGGMRTSLPAVMGRLSEAIQRLDEQMEEQEETVFAFLEHAEPQSVGTAVSEFGEPPISSTMSVNEILQRYPQTGSLFEQLRINRLHEGYESVDEVAWHHGLDVPQLLEQLRQAVSL